MAACQGRAGIGLHRDQTDILARGLVGKKGKGRTAEVGAAAAGGEDHVRVVARFLELLLGFQANHGLVQQHVVQHRAQGVIGIGARGGILHRFRDRQAERARTVGVGCQRGTAGVGFHARAGEHFRAPGLHHGAAVGLLPVAHLDHVHPHLQPEHLAGQRHRAAPLAGAGLGGDALDAGLGVVIGLSHGGVGLVRTGRGDAFVLVVDLRRGAERRFQAMGAEQRRGAPQLIDLAHFFRDRNPALGRHFLLDQAHREDRRQRLGADRLAVRTQRRRRRIGHVGDDVVPVGGDLGFVEQELGLRHGGLPVVCVYRCISDKQARLGNHRPIA